MCVWGGGGGGGGGGGRGGFGVAATRTQPQGVEAHEHRRGLGRAVDHREPPPADVRKLTVELAESGLKKIRQEANIEALAAERSDLEVSVANPGSFLIIISSVV